MRHTLLQNESGKYVRTCVTEARYAEIHAERQRRSVEVEKALTPYLEQGFREKDLEILRNNTHQILFGRSPIKP